MQQKYYTTSTSDAINDLETHIEIGLSSSIAEKRLKVNGPNLLTEELNTPIWKRILAQFKDFLVIILIIAAIISIVVGREWIDGLIIIAILIINVIISISQENKADNALKKLKEMTAPRAKVLRDGSIIEVESHNLVVGDIVIIEAGDYIPADLRLIESINLQIEEASLTGESTSTTKNADNILGLDAPIGDRDNSAYMGTIVTVGRGRGVVTASGMNTEMGNIATMLNAVATPRTPLQIKLDVMAKKLGIVLIIICAVIFIVGLINGMRLTEIFIVSVSLAVAAIPEGIAIVTTMILAIGVSRMVKSNVIIKRMSAVEALGSTTVICSDKTGTLTQNKMTVVRVCDLFNCYPVTGTGYIAEGKVENEGLEISQNINEIAKIASLCNDALYDKSQSSIIGDPTEAALLVFSEKVNLDHILFRQQNPRILELPFDSDRKLMSTFNVVGSKIVMNTKGAPDEIIKRATKYLHKGEIHPFTADLKEKLIKKNESYALEALRILGFAYREFVNKESVEEEEQDLIFVGLVAMIDPPRKEAKLAIKECHDAGITIKMITGDHKITAKEIGIQLGIVSEKDEAIEGLEINNLSDAELKEKVKTVNIFARVSPAHKVRIVEAIKNNNEIVAMTGDGVNDAPSLKKADIGIAMGITGTDVSKEASDLILTDDNFVSIVHAIEQGRMIYQNIQKVIAYLLSANIGEILIVLIALLLRFPVPLIATQLLFVNLLTDALPAFALGMEENVTGLMKNPPRDPNESLINKPMRNMIVYKSILLTIAVLSSFYYGWQTYSEGVGITFAFFTLVASELLLTYPSRSFNFTRPTKSMLTNKMLNRSIAISFIILLAVIYVPQLANIFHVQSLSISQFFIAFGFSMIPVVGSEISKLIFKT